MRVQATTTLAIRELVSTIKLPQMVYQIVESSDGLVFICEPTFEPIEVIDAASDLVNRHYRQCIESVRYDKIRYRFEISEKHVVDRAAASAQQEIINIWLKVNKKKDFRRTSLNKKLKYAIRSWQFNTFILELYADAYKYGLKTNTIPKPIEEFIAKQFQKGVEECR